MSRWGGDAVAPEVAEILVEVELLRSRAAAHEVFDRLVDRSAARTFMEHHVFAVWDFMSLLAALRTTLTGVTPPWSPVGSASMRRFVNELALAEESDVHPHRNEFTSHFELYLEGMDDIGADTVPVRTFVDQVRSGVPVPRALVTADAPPPALDFVKTTWAIVASGSVPAIAGAFAFGRESVIPDMFAPLRRVAAGDDALALFCAYLDRHIELDGDEHTPVAFRLVGEACRGQADRWREVADAATRALQARLALWDGILAAIDPAGVALAALDES